jgi:uncharacterized membrane protein YidH (DUF202 family)
MPVSQVDSMKIAKVILGVFSSLAIITGFTFVIAAFRLQWFSNTPREVHGLVFAKGALGVMLGIAGLTYSFSKLRWQTIQESILYSGRRFDKQPLSFYVGLVLVVVGFFVRLVTGDDSPNSIIWLPTIAGMLVLAFSLGSRRSRHLPPSEQQRDKILTSMMTIVSGIIWLAFIDAPHNLGEPATLVAGFMIFTSGVLLIATLNEVQKSQGKGLEMTIGQMPQRWDETFIAGQLLEVGDRPPVLTHYVDSVLDRFVLRQDERTAQARLKFLQVQLEQLKLAKTFAISLDDLQFHALERDIRHRELELKRQDLDNRQERQAGLDDLRHKLELAELKKKIRDLEASAPPPAPPSRQEIRQQQMAECEAELRQLEEEEERWIARSKADDEKREWQNRYTDLKRLVREKISKL